MAQGARDVNAGSGRPVLLGTVPIGAGEPLVVIAGLCVLQAKRAAVELAVELAGICRERSLPFVFKASFDKANRTAADAYRGPGVQAGLDILAAVRAQARLPVLTDVHEAQQVALVAPVVDVLQVPAFLCRQTDLLIACGRTGKPVNIKKGQFMVPADMRFAVDKVRGAGGQPLVTERGTGFGYGDLVVDMRSLVWLRETGAPVIFDGTHSVQQPGAGGHTGGLPDMVAPLVRAAVAVGVDGLYLEVHPDPERALCDAASCMSCKQFAALMDQLVPLLGSRRR